jgi:pyruvate/2-oxoglutarate dehydrogenase complex dihydrolipoamide acyltransferase (E2) component
MPLPWAEAAERCGARFATASYGALSVLRQRTFFHGCEGMEAVMKVKSWWGYMLWGALAFPVAGPSFAQKEPQPGETAQESEKAKTGAAKPGARQLSPASQNALARLHALNLARASYAKVGEEAARDEEVKSFLRQRAQEYEQADTRLRAFAATYGVDLQSDAMKQKTKQTLAQWDKENKKLRNSKSEQATRMALTTFIERNDQAVADLRKLRGDVQEDELRDLINQRIAAVEQESTRAQELRQQLGASTHGTMKH